MVSQLWHMGVVDGDVQPRGHSAKESETSATLVWCVVECYAQGPHSN